MKKIAMLMAFILITTAIMAVKVETTSGITHKGELIKKVGNLYFIKTNMGSVAVFQEEITKAYSDSGIEMTQAFLNMESTIEPEPLKVSPYLLTNISQISTPLWIFTVASVVYYSYTIIKMNE